MFFDVESGILGKILVLIKRSRMTGDSNLVPRTRISFGQQQDSCYYFPMNIINCLIKLRLSVFDSMFGCLGISLPTTRAAFGALIRYVQRGIGIFGFVLFGFSICCGLRLFPFLAFGFRFSAKLQAIFQSWYPMRFPIFQTPLKS